MALANMAAHQFGSDEVSSGHVLFAIVSEGKGTGVWALSQLGVDVQRVKEQLEKRLRIGASVSVAEKGKLNGSGKALIERAVHEAMILGHNYVGSEHMMFGAVLDESVAGEMLRGMGVTFERARQVVLDRFAADAAEAGGEPRATPDPSCPLCKSLRSVAAGTHSRWIKSFHECHLLLGENQGCPGWCVLVLKEHVEHMSELSIPRQQRVFAEVARVAAAVRAEFPTNGKGGGPVRINYECLGNQVAHIHWHIIPRHADDPEPTKAVWGWSEERLKGTMTAQEREGLMVRLRERLKDEPRTQ